MQLKLHLPEIAAAPATCLFGYMQVQLREIKCSFVGCGPLMQVQILCLV